MQLIFEDVKKRKIEKQEDITFSLKHLGIYVVEVSARAKGEKQLGKTDDEDLRIDIDKRRFPQLGNSERYFDSPASLSGGQLKDLKKSVYFLLWLNQGKHTLSLIPDSSATLEKIRVFQFSTNLDTDRITLSLNDQAEDGDRRPWITFVFVDLRLNEFAVTLGLKRRFIDSDDVKVIVDGEVKRNHRSMLHKLWYFAASILKGETQTEIFQTNLKPGLRYIELWADRMPVLKNIDFALTSLHKKPTPTVNNPKWTGSFTDDTDEMLLARLIFGEAEDQSGEAKTWIAGSILNRMSAPAWPDTVREVILQADQYDPFKPDDLNYSKIIDPLKDASEARMRAWRESYQVAQDILSGNIKNPTEATHFHGRGVSREWFLENIVPNGRFIKQIDNTFFYWSPN